MAEHYTRNTERVTAYCLKCRRFTEHRVDQGRKGPCLDPFHPQPKPRVDKSKLPKSGDLFE